MSEPIATALRAIAENPRIDQAFRSGIALALSKGMKRHHNSTQTGRCYVVEYHGQNRATFECAREGHQFRGQLMLRSPLGKLPSEPMLQKMAHWWGRHSADSKGGGCIMQCPKCR